MRTIKIHLSEEDIKRCKENGWSVTIPVIVDWPELQLTAEQCEANTLAKAEGDPPPYPNPAFFDIELKL